MDAQVLADHERYMRRCLELAEAALATGNVPVGALIVCGGEIIAEAQETLPRQPDVTGHAELLAVQRACRRLETLDLSHCTLYSSAEPCWMCSYALRETRVGLVVYGAPVEGIGGVSSRYPLLTDAAVPGWERPPQVIGDVLRAEGERLRQLHAQRSG